MKRLNILELHRKINEKNEKKSVCYDRVLELCHKRIISLTEKDKTSCLFEFPEYIVGLPLFDLNICIEHVYKHLVMDGFCVRYNFPKTLYISWDLEEIKLFKAEQRKQIPLHSILPQTLPGPKTLPQNPILNSPPPQIYQNHNLPPLPTSQPTIQTQQPLLIPLEYNTNHLPQNSKPISNDNNKAQLQTHVQHTLQNQIQNIVQGPLALPIPLEIPERTFQSAPLQPVKYDPFDILNDIPSNVAHNAKNKNNTQNNMHQDKDTSAMKQMLVSNIGQTKKRMFDYKPSGKLTLNI